MNAVVQQPEPQVAPGAALIQVIERAAASGNVDAVERLWAIHQQIVSRDAEIAFNDAMSACQEEMRPISADATNPQTRSKYATYGKLDTKLRPIYTKHGFSLSFSDGETPKPDHVRVVAIVRHKCGHKETHWKDMPADGKGAKGGDVMTKTHAAGAAQQYGMRYLLKGIFNVAIGEDDNDGNDEPPKAPEGYEDWKADMTALADEGTKRLQDVWQKSEAVFRRHAVMNDSHWWNATKSRSTKVKQ